MYRSLVKLVLSMSLLGLSGCLIGDPEPLDFAADPRILRGSYRGTVDTRVSSGTVALSADSRLLAMGAGDGRAVVQLWDAEMQAVVKGLGRLREDAYVSDVAISADGARVANLYLDRVQLWDTSSGAELYRLHAGPELGPCSYACLQQLELSDDAGLLAVAGGDASRVALYEGGTSMPLAVLEALGSYADDLALSADGTQLAALTSDYEDAAGNRPFHVRAWSALSEVFSFTGSSRWPQRPALSLSADGTTLAFTGGARVRVVALATQAESTLPLPHETQTLALSPDGERLAVGHFRPDGRGAIKVFEVASGRIVSDFDAPSVVRWSQDGRFLLVVGVVDPAAWDTREAGDSGAPKLLRADDLSEVGSFENGRLHGLELEATPTYETATRYRVAGTVRIDGSAELPFSGTVDGSESQRYLAPQARLPNPAGLTLRLEGRPWVLHGFQEWEQDEIAERPGGWTVSGQKLGSWDGYAEVTGEPETAFHTFYLERAE